MKLTCLNLLIGIVLSRKLDIPENVCRRGKIHIGVGTVPNYGCPEGKTQRGLLCYPGPGLLNPSPMSKYCPPGRYEKDSLCYQACPPGWGQVVTDCYQPCTGPYATYCGLAACAKDSGACSKMIGLAQWGHLGQRSVPDCP